MKIHQVAIIIIVISLLITATVSYINAVGEAHSQTADFSSLGATQDRLETMSNYSAEMEENINNFVPEEGTGGVLFIPYNFLKVAWATVKYNIQAWKVLGGVASDLTNATGELGVPSELNSLIITAIASILIIIVMSIIVYAFFKWRFED